jgi:hypothetical protein
MAVNEALIRGAAVAAGPVVDYFGAFSRGFESTYGPIMEQRKAKLKADQEKKAAQDAKIMKLLDGLEDIDIANLNPQEQKEIATKAFAWKKEYADIASQLARVSASDNYELYMELSDKLNSINNRFVNLTNNIKVQKTGKLDWADNTKAGKYSILNNLNGEDKKAESWFTGDLEVGPNGEAIYGGVTEPPNLILKDAGVTFGNLYKNDIEEAYKRKVPYTPEETMRYKDDLKTSLNPQVAEMIINGDNIIPGVNPDLFSDIDPNSKDVVDQVAARLAQGRSDVASQYLNQIEEKAQQDLQSKEQDQLDIYRKKKQIDQQFKSDTDKPTQTEITRTQKLEKIEKRAKKRVDSILKNPVLAVLAVQGVAKEDVERDPKNPRVIVIKGEDGDLRFDTNNKSDISKLAKTLEQIEFGADATTDDVKLAIDDYIAERRKKRNPLLDE